MKSFPLLFTLQYQEYTHYLKSKTFHILHFHEPSTMHFQMLHTQTYIFSLTILIFEQFHNSKSPKHFSYHCIHTLHSSISISQSNFSKEKKKKKLTCVDSNRLHPCHLLRQCWQLLPQYLLRLPISLSSSIYMQILQQNYQQNFTNFTKAFKIKVLTPFIKRVPLIIKAQNFMIIIGFSY